MEAGYLGILLTAIVAGGICAVMVTGSWLLGPKKKMSAQKSAPYECGVEPYSLPQGRFSIKFYVTAMLFVAFDVEILFGRACELVEPVVEDQQFNHGPGTFSGMEPVHGCNPPIQKADQVFNEVAGSGHLLVKECRDNLRQSSRSWRREKISSNPFSSHHPAERQQRC